LALVLNHADRSADREVCGVEVDVHPAQRKCFPAASPVEPNSIQATVSSS